MEMKVVIGKVNSGKTTKIIEMINAGNDTLGTVVLVSCEYKLDYLRDRVHKDIIVAQNVEPRDIKALIPWILMNRPSTINTMFIDGFCPSMNDLDLIYALAKYARIDKVVITMQANADKYKKEGVIIHKVYRDTKIYWKEEE